jgi:cytochrome c-type biogenesis protein CcmH/NrfF
VTRIAAAFVLLVAVVAVWVGTAGRAPTAEDRAGAIAERLRCPACQGSSVADSASPMARDIRARILAEVRAGRSDAEITGDFVRVYGDWVLLSPPWRGIGLVPWIVTLAAVAAAIVSWLRTVRRWRRAGQPRPEERR